MNATPPPLRACHRLVGNVRRSLPAMPSLTGGFVALLSSVVRRRYEWMPHPSPGPVASLLEMRVIRIPRCLARRAVCCISSSRERSPGLVTSDPRWGDRQCRASLRKNAVPIPPPALSPPPSPLLEMGVIHTSLHPVRCVDLRRFVPIARGRPAKGCPRSMFFARAK